MRLVPAARGLLVSVFMQTALATAVFAASEADLAAFREHVEPILAERCYDCHAGGMQEGSVAFDMSQEELVDSTQLWWRALRMIRAGMMPPAEMDPLSDEEKQTLETWIKRSAFHGNPQNPDPGHVTLRRLNRNEYRNTIRDLLGVDYDAHADFPQDDTGHGFDNIGSVLNVSPLLLEKYLAAARIIVAEVVPRAAMMTPEQAITGEEFLPEGANADGVKPGPRWMSYYEPAWVSHRAKVDHAGKYQIEVNLSADERYVDDQFDYNKCRLTFSVDGAGKLNQEFSRQGGMPFTFTYDVDWQPSEHELIFELTPLTPDAEQVRSLTIRIKSVVIRGPLGDEFGTPVPGYEKFFPRPVPPDIAERREYARELLQKFATRAYRRPVDATTTDRLVALAEQIYSQPDHNFEQGIAEAMTAVLASPRFLFREEVSLSPAGEGEYPYLDDYSLASRLSYFLWSTMPDDELMQLAADGKLRENLPAQFTRMFNDPRSQQFITHFVGQWLRARNIETAVINAREVMQRDNAPDPRAIESFKRFRELMVKPREELTEDEKQEFEKIRRDFRRSNRQYEKFDLNHELRQAMRRESELTFETILREDRPLVELLDNDYTFLNERLARQYGIEGVTGDEMRKVELPADSPRGGILTQGTTLIVTSNPDRTSPVKRGLFVLENILGIPPAPPPPNLPALEEAGGKEQLATLTVREALAIHRESPECSSCHNRMDPIGLALEEFNALGMARNTDHGKPIEPAGQLITGEEFTGINELKQTLVNHHRQEFYRCFTEKLLTYALGRGIEYHDTETVDALVAQLEANEGRPAVLLKGIITSAAFQKCRSPEPTATAVTIKTVSATETATIVLP
jgi:hypothetical protein